MTDNPDSYLALSGGIGGAKLALGLSRQLQGSQLTVISNTADDFEHLGLYISPDTDTLLYTLSDINNTELGWGRRDESWNFLDTCAQLGMDTWFRLGDRDLALHIYRSMRLREEITLSRITEELCQRLEVQTSVVPMSDMPVRTMLETDAGVLSFQDYFVRKRCEPRVSSIYFEGIDSAKISNAFEECLGDPNLKAIIICPSNPFLSVQPILSLPGLRSKLKSAGKPVLVVSPVIDGHSIKGPTSKLMTELGLPCDVVSIAELYRDLASTIIIDKRDESAVDKIEAMGIGVHTANILMHDLQDKIDLAHDLIELCAAL